MYKFAEVMSAFNRAMTEDKPNPKQEGPVAGGTESKSEGSKEEESEELEEYKRALLKLFGIEKNASVLLSRGSRPLTLVKRIMKGVVPPPGNAGMRTTYKASTPKTHFGSKPITIKAPTLKQLKGPNVPQPKPAQIKPGGELRPGKNVVS